METEQITVQVDAEAARAFKSVSADDRRKLEALLSIRLSEVTRTRESLKAIMSEVSQKAERRGLTPESLKAMLNEDWRKIRLRYKCHRKRTPPERFETPPGI